MVDDIGVDRDDVSTGDSKRIASIRTFVNDDLLGEAAYTCRAGRQAAALIDKRAGRGGAVVKVYQSVSDFAYLRISGRKGSPSVVVENTKAGARSAQTAAIYFLPTLACQVPARPCFSSNLCVAVDADGQLPKINMATDAAATFLKNTIIEPAHLL